MHTVTLLFCSIFMAIFFFHDLVPFFFFAAKHIHLHTNGQPLFIPAPASAGHSHKRHGHTAPHSRLSLYSLQKGTFRETRRRFKCGSALQYSLIFWVFRTNECAAVEAAATGQQGSLNVCGFLQSGLGYYLHNSYIIADLLPLNCLKGYDNNRNNMKC